MTLTIALIGYGEVGRILAEDLGQKGHSVAAFDIALPFEAGQVMRRHAAAHRVRLAESHADAVRSSDFVVSAVTASQTVAAAEACARALEPACFFLDLNSASPGAKLSAARHVVESGSRYVEGAVMTSVPPYRMKVPLLIGGPEAAAALPLLRDLGFAAKVASNQLGVASATKMCRSVVVKGLEAMLIESFTAARHYGVEAAVIDSLTETFPGIDWERQAAYFFQRVVQHGQRRSEEMREVAITVSDAGLEPWSASGTAERQAWVAELAARGVFGEPGAHDFARNPNWRTEADRILKHLQGAKTR